MNSYLNGVVLVRSILLFPVYFYGIVKFICVSEAGLIPIPEGMSDEVACQAFVNPVTAYGMLETSCLGKGGSLLITAGASAWGKVVIQ